MTWGDISIVENKLRLIELKCPKAILNVKDGTTSGIIYYELNRGDIISKIKDRQWKFYKRIKSMSRDDSITIDILALCRNT